MRRKDRSLIGQVAIAKVDSSKRSLAFVDAVALIIGIVIGAGIFETPALVAANAGNNVIVMLTWLAGGAISLVGALCYADLATAYPHVGGNYYYLKRAFGRRVAFLFAWARMTVIQTGSIALLAFVFGDYASRMFSFGTFSTSIYAAGAIALLLTGISLLVLRMREPHVQRPFQVPLYPLTPLLFCAVCAYLFYSSLAYTGVGAITGILVVGLGIPLWQWHCAKQGRV